MNNIPDFLRVSPEMQKHFAKGGMIKRADGNYSKKGLWDNIRANKGSGRKPTKEMLEQEHKIRAKEYEIGGETPYFDNGGYYGPFYNRTDAAKLQRWRSPMANSMTPSFDIGGEIPIYQSGTTNVQLSPQWDFESHVPGQQITAPQQDQNNQVILKDNGINAPIDPINNQPSIELKQSSTPNFDFPNITNTNIEKNGLDAIMNPLSSKFENTINQLNILSRISKRSNENANYNFAKSQDILPNTQNKTETYQGVEYAKHGGIMGGDLKEGQEIELTPTQMYLLEKKGYKFQII